MMSHSILPPSSAGIWGPPGGCTGWVLMAQTYPETEESEDAREGEASHEIGSSLILDAARGVNHINSDKFIGNAASNGVIFTDVMFDGAKMYADHVAAIMRHTAIFGGINFGNESKVHASQIHDLSYGTTDQYIFDRPDRTLWVWDYKFGFETVEAFENWQTINYVAGIVKKLNIEWMENQDITVRINIVQPRAIHRDGPIREWVVKLHDLRGHFNQLYNAANEALGNNSVIQTGGHCRHCQARHDCEAAIQAGMGLYEVVRKPIPMNLTPEALGVQLAIVNRAADQIKYIQSGLKEQVKSLVKGGSIVPNFIGEMGYGNLAWDKPVSEIIQLGVLYGKELKKPDTVITPTQALATGIDPKIIKEYSSKAKTGLKIVPDNGSKARQIFL